MSQWIIIGSLTLVAAVAGSLGWFLAHTRGQREIARLKHENIALQTTLDLERRATEEKLATVQNVREQLNETFAALSSKALKSNTEEFLKLANEPQAISDYGGCHHAASRTIHRTHGQAHQGSTGKNGTPDSGA